VLRRQKVLQHSQKLNLKFLNFVALEYRAANALKPWPDATERKELALALGPESGCCHEHKRRGGDALTESHIAELPSINHQLVYGTQNWYVKQAQGRHVR
jgi:hypothetical protein